MGIIANTVKELGNGVDIYSSHLHTPNTFELVPRSSGLKSMNENTF